METKNTDSVQYKKLSIKDINTILKYLLVIVISGFLSFIFGGLLFAGTVSPEELVQVKLFASISASIFILSFFMLRAEWSGYVADVNTMKLTIPGKGLMANSILDYVNPIYWLRYFRRIDVDFAKLQQISTSVRDYTSIIQRFFSGDRVPKTSWFYDINLSCIDDTYRLTFRTKNKREQLYAMIVQINQMGSPILNR